MSENCGTVVPKNYVTAGFGVGGITAGKMVLANMLTAATILIATKWKSQEVPELEEWDE